MLQSVYTRVFETLKQKPLKLWGISLLANLLASVLGILCGIAPIVSIAISTLFSISLALIFLQSSRGNEIHVVQLFECFKDWETAKRILLGMGWMYLWVFLWALIPIVGPVFAIIRAYEYRLTPYILVFDPEVPVTEAINISKEKTNGYKMQMFLAELVYLAGYFVLALIVGLLSSFVPFLGVLLGLLLLAYAVLLPLVAGLVQAIFYEAITSGEPAAPAADTKICPNCGNKISANASFCPNCGNRF